MNEPRTFEHGMVTAAIGGGVCLLLFFSIGAPTNEYRARIAFIFGSIDIISVVIILAGFTSVGACLLVFTRSFTIRALHGVVVSSLGLLLFFYAFAQPRWLPEIRSSRMQWFVAFVVVIAGIAGLVREHRSYKASGGD